MDPSQNAVPLSLLIDYMVQQTYHDLIVLSELLPRKKDVERKTSIYQFSNRSHQQFVRLLGLVKWACRASRVDKCTEIIMFLDKQSSLFVDTADCLFQVAKESLKNASFPVFGLQSAVDVLVGGSYSRLPASIKDKIIPALTLSEKETSDTLSKLTKLIEQRLVLSKIPIKYKTIEIENGYVKLTVPHEFSVRLTVPNDDFKNPWRLLSYDVLVQNPANDDPRSVIHLQQKEYITELLQSRLFDPDKEPLEDLCITAHNFSLLLQMEILYSQAQKMRNGPWKTRMNIIDYNPGRVLTICYWSALPNLGSQQALLIIYYPDSDPLNSFQVDHRPDIAKIPHRDVVKIDFSNLSLERLLMDTIEHRSYEFLSRLKVRLQDEESVKIVDSHDEDELVAMLNDKIELRLSVDHYSGLISCQCNYNVLAQEFIKSVNDTSSSLGDGLNKIRMRVDLLLTKNTLIAHNIRHHLSLPLQNKQDFPQLASLFSALYVGFKSNSQYCLVIDLQRSKLQYLLIKLMPAVCTADSKHVVLHRVVACTRVTDIPAFSVIDLNSMEPLDVILKMERATLYILLQEEWKRKGQKCLGIVPIQGEENHCLRLLTLPTNHPILKQLLKDLTVHIHGVTPLVVKYSLTFDTKHPILPANTNGIVQTLYSTSLKLVVENFSLMWKGIHYLFTLVYNFQSLKNETLGRIVRYNFNSVTVGYSVQDIDYMVYIDLRQNKYRLVFYQSKGGAANPHALIREHLEHDLGTHQCIFKLLYTLQRTAYLYNVLYSLPSTVYWGLEKSNTSCKSVWTFISHSSNAVRLIYKNSMALDITCYTADKYGIKDAAIQMMSGSTVRAMRYNPLYLLSKLLDTVTKKVEGATCETVTVTTHPSDQVSKYPAASPQPATPSYSTNPQPGTPSYPTQPATPVYHNPSTPGYQQPGTPGYPGQNPATPSYPSPANKPQPSPQNPNPFVQPNPSPMGAPSPAIMSLMSPQTPQYMPPSPAPVPSPGGGTGYIQQPSPGAAQHILGSPSYRNPNSVQNQTSYGVTPSPSGGSKAQARVHRNSTTLFVNRIMLDSLLSYTNNSLSPDNNICQRKTCVLESLLSACLLKRQIPIVVHDIKGLTIRSNELLSTLVTHDMCIYRFNLDPNHYHTLHLTVTPTREGFWNKHLTDTLSTYFVQKIAVTPYRPNALPSFLRILGSQKDILQQFLNMMDMELNPDPRFQWRLTWCPCVPPEFPPQTQLVLQPGMTGAVFSNTKILFFVRLEHPGRPNNPVVIPIVFDSNTGNIKRADIQPQDYMSQRVQHHFTRCTAQLNDQGAGIIHTALVELLQNLDPSIPGHVI